MEITSIGFLSETMFQRFDGIVRDHGDFVEVQTPRNPAYWFGNYLLLGGPPEARDVLHWVTRFDACFADVPEVLHKCLQWSGVGLDGAALRAAFEQLGFRFEQAVVLAATETSLPRPARDGVAFRKLSDDFEWQQALENQILCGNAGIPAGEYRAFKVKQMENFRRLQSAGKGAWYGAFKGIVLVADMGIFHRENVSRFQSVGTHPDHRRQGICAGLVHHVSCETQAQYPGNQMVIDADAGEPAERVYKNVGFVEIEQMQSAVLAPKPS